MAYIQLLWPMGPAPAFCGCRDGVAFLPGRDRRAPRAALQRPTPLILSHTRSCRGSDSGYDVPGRTRAAPMTWGYAADSTSATEYVQREPETLLSLADEDRQPPFNEKPLKINRDLLLYRAKRATESAGHASTYKQRTKFEAKAEAALQRCMAMDATDGRAYVGLGKLFVRQRRYDDARRLYEDGCMATDGANAHLWQAWATLEARCGNVNYARELFDAAVTANNTHAAAWHGWGLLEKRQGNLLEARDLWLKGIRKTRKRPNQFLFQSVAVLAGEMGLTHESRKWFQEATRTFTGAGIHGIWQAWAQMEARQGNRDVVRHLLQKGLEAAPRSRYLHLTWALWEKELGQRDNARMLLRRGHTFNRSDPALLQAWAIMDEEDGLLDSARSLFEQATVADPHHTPVWQAWGCMEQRQGNLARARELFQAGVWAEPGARTVTTVWQAWGVLEAQQGNLQLARQLFKCAVKADPTSQPSWQAWATLEESLNNIGRADELRTLQRQGNLQIVWPRGFAAGFAPPSEMSPDSPLDPIIRTMSQWFANFGAKRPGRQQPSTSRQSGQTDVGGSEMQERELEEAMQQMTKANTPILRLPRAPIRSLDEAEWDTEL